jgi:hypothetical protein
MNMVAQPYKIKLFSKSILLIICVLIPKISLADCPGKSDPSISCTKVITPCNSNGTNNLLPGYSAEGKDWCSGNLNLDIQIGPVTAYYNSQLDPLSADARVNEGLGKGVTFLSRITPQGSNVWVRTPDGALLDFTLSATNQWYSSQRHRGDLRELKFRSGRYELRDSDGSSIILSKRIGRHIFPTSFVDVNGAITTISYNGDLPSQIKSPAGGIIQFSCDSKKCNSVFDNTGLEYTLGYVDEYLVAYLDPASGTHKIKYSSSASDKETFITQISSPVGGLTNFAYYTGGHISAIGDGARNSIFTYSPTSVTIEYDTPSGTRQSNRVNYSNSTSGALIKETFRGDGRAASNPGVLTSQTFRDSSGRIISTTDMFGETTKYFYSANSNCSNNTPQVIPIPTCEKKSTGAETQISVTGPDMFFSPTKISIINRNGTIIKETNLAWRSIGLLRSASTLKNGEIVSSFQISYNGNYPTEMVSTETVSTTFDPRVKGRIATQVFSNGDDMSNFYDSIGNLTRSIINGVPQNHIVQSLAGGKTRTMSTEGSFASQTEEDYFGTNVTSFLTSTNRSSPPPALVTSSTTISISNSGIGTRTNSVISRNGGSFTSGETNNLIFDETGGYSEGTDTVFDTQK